MPQFRVSDDRLSELGTATVDIGARNPHWNAFCDRAIVELRRLTLLAIALLFGALLPAYPVLVIGAALLVATWAAKRGGIPGRVVVTICLCMFVQGVRGYSRMGRHAAARTSLVTARPAPARCDGIGEVLSSPVRAGAFRFDVAAEGVHCDGTSDLWSGAVRLYLDEMDEALVRGDRIAFIAQLGVPEAYANDAVEHPGLALGARTPALSGGALYVRLLGRGRGPPAWVDSARNHVRRRIQATFARDTEALARALMLGETDLSLEEGDRFRTSGLAHLLAVSGVHLALAVGASVRGLRALLSRIGSLTERLDVGRLAAGFGVPLSWIYADFAGGSGSARRAALMLSVSYVTTAWNRKSSAPRSLALSGALAASSDPLVILDASFSLSLVATVGLMVLGGPLTEFFARKIRWKPVATSLGATVAATLACVPVLASLGSSVPLAGIPLNLVAVPLGELAALPLCLAHGLLAPWPAAERWTAQTAGGALRLVDALAAIGSQWQGFELPPPTPGEYAILVTATALALVLRLPRSRLVYLATGATLLLALTEGALRLSPRKLRVTFLDVGQGDSAVIETPHGGVIVVDGGGLVGSPTDVGRRVLAPFLRAKRLRQVSLVVLSHPHPDHFGGLSEGLAGARVETVWDSGLGRQEGVSGGYQAWLHKMTVQHAAMPSLGDMCGLHMIDEVRLEVLAPCPSFDSDRGANDNSIVLRVTYGERSVLFVGDAEHAEEALLLRDHASKLHADVLKVGHHGSRTSTGSAFLAAVSPRVAVISSGVRNRFGHPVRRTLDTLADAHVDVLRTDRRGAITIESDGRSLEVRTAR